jgi:hypothetical protein
VGPKGAFHDDVLFLAQGPEVSLVAKETGHLRLRAEGWRISVW